MEFLILTGLAAPLFQYTVVKWTIHSLQKELRRVDLDTIRASQKYMEGKYNERMRTMLHPE